MPYIIKLQGGLGNQLFQYAFARALQEKTGKKVFCDTSFFITYPLHKFALFHFGCKNIFFTIPKIKLIFKLYWCFLRAIFYLADKIGLHIQYIDQIKYFEPGVFKRNRLTYFNGYWQSEKYFFTITEQLKKELVITTPPSEQNRLLLENINKQFSVSLHVRRGDYLAINWVYDPNYYVKATKYILEKEANAHFYIFSDDIAWCKQNFDYLENKTFVDHNNEATGYEDLRLMSACKHNIIANSTFSWWGAWLNPNANKIVIAPKKWMKEDILLDIVPENWVKL